MSDKKVNIDKFILEYEISVCVLDTCDELLLNRITRYWLYVFCNSVEEAKDMKEYIDKNVIGAICKNFCLGYLAGELKTKIGDGNGILFQNGCVGSTKCVEVLDKTQNLVHSFDKWYRERFRQIVKMLLDSEK